MNAYPESLRPLAEVVEALIAHTSALIEQLAEEHAALLERDTERLSRVVQAKGAAARGLQALEARLQAVVGPGGIPPSYETHIARVPNGGTSLAARWLELGRLARLASDANRENGVLLDARERQVRGALNALQPDAPTVYGRGGYGRPSFGGRVHGSA
jgi:flagellar biosynthesis/type III secretory pathway chaperone